uniref:Uncharacterized protein n=1 Tax=Oryctolagus cuniculus TaxID=9986 RepID=A0A5F9CNQ7_RABIT
MIYIVQFQSDKIGCAIYTQKASRRICQTKLLVFINDFILCLLCFLVFYNAHINFQKFKVTLKKLNK